MTQRPPARRKAILRALALVVPLAAASTAFSQQVSVCGTDFPHSNAALGRICMPGLVPWNGNLIVFAHGYVAPGEPIAIPESQLTLPDGASIPEIVNGLGFGFATTSYSKNGLAVLEGVADVTDLVQVFGKRVGQPRRVYLVGASEGGLVTTLAVEQPDVFSGGVATCGPVGDFRRQIDYWGDFRVLFDFYFPGVIPGDVLSVEDEVRENWKTRYVPAITRALTTRPALLDKLLRVSRAPFDPNDPESKIETALGILWYNVFATNDARAQLGGNPYDNSRRLYLGSGNDFWLNLLVERYHADWTALAEIDVHYQTNGRLEAPLVTLHTTADPIVPYWHEPLYSLKALANSGLLHANVPVFRYGHCSFKAEEALVALGLLVLKVEGRELLNAERVLPTKQARLRYRSLAKTHGLRR